MKQVWGPGLAAPATLWLLIAFAAPLGAVLLLALQATSDPFAPLSLSPSLQQFATLFEDGFYARIVLHTSLLAIEVALLCALLGYPLALWLTRLGPRAKPFGFALVLVPILINVVVRSLGIVLLLAPDGLINGVVKALGMRPWAMLYTDGAILLGLTQVFLPFMTIALYDILQSTAPAVRQASESLGASPAQRFFSVDLPLSLPGLRAGLILVFLSASTSYVTATMLGGKKVLVTGMLVWQEALSNLNGAFASALALLMLAVGVAVTALVGAVIGRLTPWLRARPAGTFRLPRPVVRLCDAVAGVVPALLRTIAFVLLALPLLLVVVQSFNDVPQATVAGFRGFTLRWYTAVLTGGAYLDSFWVSLRLAVVSALCAVILATSAAFAMVRTRFVGQGLVAAFWMLPISLPHVAIGVGMLRLLQTFTALPPFLGLVLVHVTLILPFSIGLMRAAVLLLDPIQEEAAQSLGAGRLRRLVFVILPGLAPSLVAAGTMAFLLSFEEVTVTSFLTTARLTTLPVRIYAESTFSLTPTVHAVSTLTILFVAVLLALLSRVVRLDRLFAR